MGFRYSGSEKDESGRWPIFFFFAPWKHVVMWEFIGEVEVRMPPSLGCPPPCAPLFLTLMTFLLQVKHATNQIVMNCADIDIITASYAPEGDEGRAALLLLFYGNVFLLLLPTVNNFNRKNTSSLEELPSL